MVRRVVMHLAKDQYILGRCGERDGQDR
ncbi:RNA polymerase sigma factor [Roseovarius sp. 217]|nr:RNA polymerase sigma factor [Roseovarius sp. 217]